LEDLPANQEKPAPEAIQKIVSSLPVDHSGTSVYVKGWRHASCVGYPILIVHDLGEQTEMYRHTCEEIVARGHNVYMFDLRGHGRSGKRLGHAPSYDILIKDLLQVAAWVRHKEDGKTPIIIGHGIGALITMDFTKTYPNLCRAMVLSAPVLELVHETTGMTRFFIKVMADVAPMLRIPVPLCPQFTRDLMNIQHQIDEEDTASVVYFPRLTAVFANELLNAIKRAEMSFITYQGACLILCPTKDDVCTYGAVKKAVAVHTADNISVIDFPDMGHALITDEHSRSEVVDRIVRWVDDITLTTVQPVSHPPTGFNESTLTPIEEDDFPVSQSPGRIKEKPGATRS
jgi:alpha-beta hydrolase superfamily lysophospholipase